MPSTCFSSRSRTACCSRARRSSLLVTSTRKPRFCTASATPLDHRGIEGARDIRGDDADRLGPAGDEAARKAIRLIAECASRRTHALRSRFARVAVAAEHTPGSRGADPGCPGDVDQRSAAARALFSRFSFKPRTDDQCGFDHRRRSGPAQIYLDLRQRVTDSMRTFTHDPAKCQTA